MKKKTFVIVPVNDGAGACNLKFFTTMKKAESWEEGEQEGFGESCARSLTITVSDDGEITIDEKLDPERDTDGWEID